MAIKNTTERKQRAQLILAKTIYEGKSHKDVAKELNISTDTVTREIQWAEDAKIFVEHEQRLLTELLPLAHQAAKMALEDGDAQVAIKIMEMVEKKVDRSSDRQDKPEGGLYAEIRRLREGRVIDVTPGRDGQSAPHPAGNSLVVVPISPEQWRVHGPEEDSAGESADRPTDVEHETGRDEEGVE